MTQKHACHPRHVLSGIHLKFFGVKKIRVSLINILDKLKKHSERSQKIVRWVIGLVNLVVLVYVLLPSFSSHKDNLRIGDIVPWDIRATKNFPIIDEEATERQRKINIDSIYPVFDINLGLIDNTQKKISNFFEKIKSFGQNNPPDFKNQKDRKKVIEQKNNIFFDKEFEKIKDELYINIDKEIITVLLEYLYKNDDFETFKLIEKNTLLMVKEVMTKGILINKDIFKAGLKNKIQIHYPDRGKAVELDITEVFDENEASEAIKNDALQLFPDDEKNGNLIYELSVIFIKPNLSYNYNKTKEFKEKAKITGEYIYTIVKKGEIIAREGERISEAQYKKYQALIENEKNLTLNSLLSRILIVLIFIILSYYYLSRQYPKIFYDNSMLILITLIFDFSLLLQKIIYQMQFPPYLIPTTFSSMLLSVLISPRVAFYFTGISALLVGLIMDENLVGTIIFFTAGTAGIISMTRIRDRISITKAGFYVSFINALSILSISLYEMTFGSMDRWGNFFWGGVNGIAAAALTGILLPPIETSFNITTDIKLLELSDLNHPLLKKLAIEAPGSYHHSIIVGNMAEAAASAIGANALLARVSSYYHDIGKITKPEYFIENHLGNKHDNLSSTLSTLIVTSHIKDGIELAHEYKLPQVIIDIIKQHHGTSLVQFFYQRALLEENEDITGEVKDYEYRYEGPKPQTQEAAIVMLADSIEAASRVLKEQNAPRVNSLIKSVINNKLTDGQFDECDITLKDLSKITDVFERMLLSFFHSRIEYPEEKNQDEDKENENNNHKQAEEKNNK